MKSNLKYIFWLDLEMTGLDPAVDKILQAALVVTDTDLSIIEEMCFEISTSEEDLALMGDYVFEMHTKSGLIEKVRNSELTLNQVESKLENMIRRYKGNEPAVLAGNSIWADRRFLKSYMPTVDKLFHYRMIDVSSLKVLVGMWLGEEAIYDKPKDEEHTALFDVRQSIEELKHYKKTLFFKEDIE